MPRRIASFRALPTAERKVLLEALLRLPLNAALLRLRGLGAPAGVPARHGMPAVSPERIAALVAVASRHGLVRGNCLSQSLTLQQLLRRAGVAAQLRIGARRAADGIEAHAWIEHEGRPLNDSADVAARYPPFTAGPGGLPRLV
jgi:hypothetical protein